MQAEEREELAAAIEATLRSTPGCEVSTDRDL